MSITLGAEERRKTDVDELSGLVLSGVSFGVIWVGNLESVGPGECDPLGNSEGNEVGNKIGIYNVEIMGSTPVVADRSKLGCDEGSGQLLYGGKVEVRSLVEFLWVEVGTEVGPCDGMSDGRYLCDILFGSWTKKWVDLHLQSHLVHNM